MFTNIGNQFKKQLSLIKEMADDFVKYIHSEWSEFTLHEKRYNYELNNYLTLKYNLLRKK